MPAFKVQTDAYHGPLDLLLYLVRKEELPIAEVPLADVTRQYLEFVSVLERLDPDAVGEFLDVASTLLEIKSRCVLPAAEEAAEDHPTGEPPIESHTDLVERLLEYKQYRDATEQLETLRIDWSKRRARSVASPTRTVDPSERPIEGVELWDLVSAFARLMRERVDPPPDPETIHNDETPIHEHMERIDRQLRSAESATPFEDLFPEDPVHKSTLVGVFIAMLELIRYGHALVEQADAFGAISLSAGDKPYRV